MTELRRGGRHSATAAAAQRPADVEPEAVWVPPPYEPARPGDFVAYNSGGFQARRSHRGRALLLLVVLVAGLAGGGWWYYERSHQPADTSHACADAAAAAASVSTSFSGVHATTRLPVGVPMPSESVWVACAATFSGSRPAEIVFWDHARESDYGALLAAAGWLAGGHTGPITRWFNGTNTRTIYLGTVDQHLVGLYID